MAYIELNNLTKDYGHGQGIVDLNIAIEKGEVFGFVGTNGSGKTTTIRHLMGFIKPQKGLATIDHLDCWKDSAEIKKNVGYVPGEIAFPDLATGTEFLNAQAKLLALHDISYAEILIKKLQLDPSANLKRMSKGMKQKTAIVAALMADPEILILDEPTTGLDPLMRAEFIDILKEEKKKGKTIFMSSHMFEEVEETCDKVAMIKDGQLIAIKQTADIKYNKEKVYHIAFTSVEDYEAFQGEDFQLLEQNGAKNEVTITLHDDKINKLFQALQRYNIQYLSEKKYTMEQYFKSLY